MKYSLTLCLGLLLIFAIARPAAAQPDAGPTGWQATVKLDSAEVYSGVSASSKVVGVLKRGDSVFINMEITGSGGTWYGITTGGETAVSGYLNRTALEVSQPTEVARWEYLPPPDPKPPAEAQSAATDRKSAIAAYSKGQIERDIKSFFTTKFGRTLPVSAFGQTRLHDRLGFDHRNGIDVALSPDSTEGRAVLDRLRGLGVPFIAFRRAVPGVATGAHIHVGKPSPRK
jgi:hypothetical protein